MDRLKMLIRDDCARAADAYTFSPAEMLAGMRERQRLHRRRVMVGVSTVIVVTLMAVTVGAAATLGFTRVAPAVSPSASAAGGSLGAFWPGTIRGAGPAVLDATFTDSQNGYLTVVRCHEVVSSCTLDLAMTSDGGISWSRRALPTRPQYLGELRPNHEIIAGGSGVVLYTCWLFTNPCSKRGERQLELYVSNDAGSTWRLLRTSDIPHVEALPDDAVVGLAMLDEHTVDSVLLVAARPDGSVTGVRGPALWGPQPRVLTGDDGSLFIYGTFALRSSGASEVTAPNLFVSRDRGLSWQRLSVPVQITKTPNASHVTEVWPDQLLTRDGRMLIYVSRVVDLDKFGGRTLATSIHRSPDGGRSWQTITPPNLAPLYDSTLMSQLLKGYAGQDPPSNIASAALLPDNSLLVSQGGRLSRLAPTESAFQEVIADHGRVYLIQAGAMVLGIDSLVERDVLGNPIRLTDTFSITTDGETWRQLKLPD